MFTWLFLTIQNYFDFIEILSRKVEINFNHFNRPKKSAWNYFTDEIKELRSNGYIDPDSFHWNVEIFISAD